MKSHLLGRSFLPQSGKPRAKQRRLRLLEFFNAAPNLPFPMCPLLIFQPKPRAENIRGDLFQGWACFAEIDNQAGPEALEGLDLRDMGSLRHWLSLALVQIFFDALRFP